MNEKVKSGEQRGAVAERLAGNEWETPEFLKVQSRFDQAAKLLNMDPNDLAPMRHPKRCLSVVVPTRMDDGTVRTFAGYRVHHDLALGPGKGGIAFHETINMGEVASLAMLMTWKCALMNLPFGGAHGGICLNPHEMSSRELERVTRRFTSEIIELIGPDIDIPGPDLNTNQETMAWIMDTYSVNHGYTIPSVVTGKPATIGGSIGLVPATGYGVSYCARRAAEHLQMHDQSPTVVIQGLGSVGSAVATSLHDAGFTVVAVSDSTGGVYNPNGLAMPKLNKHIADGKPLREFADAQFVTNDELLELKCDILVPCAVSHVINAENAAKLKCRILVEGANSPTAPDADDILDSKHILVMPDVLANASGVTAAYFEWVQGLMRLFWTDHEVYERLETLMARACDSVFANAEKRKTTMRLSAISIAVERIAEARRLRGLYP